MKHFEANGLWYPSDDSTNAVGGTLKFDKDGLQLALLGSFRQGWSPKAEEYAIIRGVVAESPYGVYVTLIDCYRNKMNFSMAGVTSEKIRCHKAVIGNCHLPVEPTGFESIDLDFTYLSEWVGQGGMVVDMMPGDGKTCVASYRKPENVEFSFGDKTLFLAFTFKASHSTHQTTLTEAARVFVKPVGEISPQTLGQEHVRSLQDLLSFATDTANAVEEIVYRAETQELGLRPKLHLIYSPILQLEEKKESFHSTDMLFCYADAQTVGINIFQKWLDFAVKHQAFMTVYFADIYAQPRYLDDKFAKVLDAFTLLCVTLRETTEKAKRFVDEAEVSLKSIFPENERELLGHVLPSSADVEMPFHLLAFLRENAALMSQLVDDFPGFVRSVSHTLYFIRWRIEGEHPPLQGVDLHSPMEKMRMLIKILVLKELGFSEDYIKVLVERNKWFNYLKTV
jgi:ApeA N-terminal domain 1